MFTKKRIVALALAAAMSMSMVLTSCTTTPSPTTSKSKYPGTTGAGSVTVNIGTEPPKINSVLVTDSVSSDVLRHLLDGLVVLDKDSKPVAGVAKDWKISDDKLVYTFNLRNDYTWSNGDKVTAKDFEFAFRSLIDPKVASQYAGLGYAFKNAQNFAEGKCKIEEVGIKAIDDFKFEVTLEKPTTYLLDMLTNSVFLPLNEKAVKAAGDKYATEASNLLTNGAFTMESWQHESEIVMKKNPKYPKASEIKVEKIVMKMIKDSNTAMNLFKSNGLDLMNLNGDQLAQMKTENQPTVNYDTGSCSYFEFNTKDKVLGNQKVRQALTYAVDSESFIKNVLKNKSTPATQFTPPCINGNTKSFFDEVGPQFKTHDVETAKKLMEEAKAELKMDKIEVTLLIEDSDRAQKYGAFFQEKWQSDLGIKVNVESVPFKSKLAKLTAEDFQITLGGWIPDYNDPINYLELFESGNGNNHTSYSNPAYDELLKKARNEADKAKRFGYLMDAEKLVMKDMPLGPYMNEARDYTLSAKLTGVVRSAFQALNLKYATSK